MKFAFQHLFPSAAALLACSASSAGFVGWVGVARAAPGRPPAVRDGELYDSRFGVRGRGQGPYAAAIGALFTNTATRLGLVSSGHYDAAI